MSDSIETGRGKPKKGYRITKRFLERGGIPYQEWKAQQEVLKLQGYHAALPQVHIPKVSNESVEQISMRISTRFGIMAELSQLVIDGKSRALFISGPPGLGKSFSVEAQLLAADPEKQRHIICKGTVGLTGLYKVLFDYRQHNDVIVFDDADSVFADDSALNLLKAATDSSKTRIINYRKEINMVGDRYEEPLPRSFEFNGSIIFITNEDFDGKIAKGHRLAPHFAALMSRANYIDLELKSQKDYLVRIKQVIDSGMLRDIGCNALQEAATMQFLESKADTLRDISLRTAIRVAELVKSGAANWQDLASIALCKNV